MAENKILDELKKATEQVQEIAKMEAEQRLKYKEEVAKQFLELQKTVHSIISEEGIILNNFEWKWITGETNKNLFDSFIKSKAKLFASKYGFKEEIVEEILKTKNTGTYRETIRTFSYFMLVPKEQ